MARLSADRAARDLQRVGVTRPGSRRSLTLPVRMANVGPTADTPSAVPPPAPDEPEHP
jgi:hypothetical protein